MRQQSKCLEQLLVDKAKVEGAWRAAVLDALSRHKKAGNPVAV